MWQVSVDSQSLADWYAWAVLAVGLAFTSMENALTGFLRTFLIAGALAIGGLATAGVGGALASQSDECEGAYENSDYAAALRLCRAAANQGDAVAPWDLGVMYRHGYGVAKNDKEAVKWYRLAAKRGDASGQVSLGFMYANGRGVANDLVKAYAWVFLAAEQGDANGATNRDLFATKMSPAQIATAKATAAKCKATNYLTCD